MSAQESSTYQGKAGRLCLDFANTVGWHASDHPEEKLRSYSDLIDWAQGIGLLAKPEAQRLRRDAEANPDSAERVLRRAIRLREAVYRIFVSVSNEKPPAEADLDELNQALARISNGAGIAKTAQGFDWAWKVDRTTMDLPIGAAALSAAELLVSADRDRVGQCADERGCGWLFLDTSKNRSRRWCDSKDCGNRDRQHRHYQRTRGLE